MSTSGSTSTGQADAPGQIEISGPEPASTRTVRPWPRSTSTFTGPSYVSVKLGPMYWASIGTMPVFTSSISQPPDSTRARYIDLLESADGRAVSQVPTADLRRRGRPGAGRSHAAERDRERPAPPGVPLRRAAGNRQDVDGAHPCEERQLRAG